MKSKNKEVVELNMRSDEFDRMMRGALAVEPPKRERKKRIRKNNRSKPGKA
jgi:hypothetical protein